MIARRRFAVSAVGLGILLAGCGGGTAPEVPAGPEGTADEVLVTGREIYIRRCASCHGAGGTGGRGPAFADGRIIEQYPEIEDQIEVVANGRGAMPAFADVLEPEEIVAVVRYTREVLAEQ